MPSDPARSPFGDRHVCSAPGCRRPSCFQVRLETVGAAPGPDAASRAGDSCGTHLADVVQALAQRCRGDSGETAQIVVYATPEGRHADGNRPPGPFDRLTLGVIPI
ncbi:hypothetical protein F8568_002645 [Actinomadura sp. LD22]|uniref:Uncharacterized protein n=1 Tax=Actinomadura physcomitrii TaxID=2650748 RepID=A0A6I4M0M6_9ACTN|nr:hypothetical protein [Actinomadura physcomitrii]MVZ99302.1 hypothetical protein [Actinomadura physcomitrii]